MASDDTIEWEVRWIIFPKRLIDGTRSDWSELLACRKVSGKWQYRIPTGKEIHRHLMDQW